MCSGVISSVRSLEHVAWSRTGLPEVCSIWTPRPQPEPEQCQTESNGIPTVARAIRKTAGLDASSVGQMIDIARCTRSY